MKSKNYRNNRFKRYDNIKTKNEIKLDKINNKKIYKFITINMVIIIILIITYIYLLKLKKNIVLIEEKINVQLNEDTMDLRKKRLDELNEENNKNEKLILEYSNYINDINQQITLNQQENNELSASVDIKKNELNTKVGEYQFLNKKYRDLTTIIVPNIITYNQYPKYPNGCEAVALYILLKYYNVNVNIESVMDALPKGNPPYYNGDVLYGGDPNFEFLGDPASEAGWGIYDQGLAITANKFKDNIINGTGMDFNEIYNLITNNRPVIVWTSIDLKNSSIYKSWISDKTGEIINWKRYNHALVVIGYNESEIVVSDPINGQIRYFDKERFIYMYNYMGRRVIYY